MTHTSPLADPGLGERLADIAIEASRVILPYWRGDLEIVTKADDSPVTIADRRAEDLILERLKAAFPDIPVISEEDASDFGVPEAIGPRFFLVDPLDGTKAFVRGDPSFTVNIGLVEDGRPIAGAVALPAESLVWFACLGRAWRRGFADREAAAVKVRPWPTGGAVALISHTMDAKRREDLRREYGFATAEPLDSSVKLCRIAEGAADLYPRHGPTMEWDIAAGHAILEAAGGSLTTLDRQAFRYGKAEEGFRNGGFVARGGPPINAG